MMILLSTILLIQLFDFISTYYVLKYKGAKELNPVVRWLIDRTGLFNGLLISKGLVAFLVLAVPLPEYILLGVIAYYLYFMYGNLKLMLK